MEEEYAAFLPVISEKKYQLYLERYQELMISGIDHIQADKLASQERDNSKFDLSEAETVECLKTAKESKFYRLKSNQYFESLKHPKIYPQPTSEEFCLDVEKRICELTGENVNNQQFEILKKYFTKDASIIDSGYSLSKGLILVGPVGCGKTTLMKVFSKNPQQSYSLISCRNLADKYKEKSMNGIYKYFDTIKNTMPHLYYGQLQLGWCFDDLGTESAKKNYGDELNVMAEVILNWYDKLGIGFNKIHITTNLSAFQIEEIYGARVRSRMREMFNIIEFDLNEKDKRK